MTDEREAEGRGNPGRQSASLPAADDPADRRGDDRVARPVEPLGASAGGPESDLGVIRPAADHSGTAPSDGRVRSLDGGVTTRLARRCLTAAAILIGGAALCLLPVTLRRWDAPSAVLALVSLAAIVGGVIMWRRRSLWKSVAGAALPMGLGLPATTGDPRALSPRRNGWPIKRRFVALVLPLRADSGATPGDGALIVHARADGAAPAAGDRLRVLPIARRGDPLTTGTDPRTAIRVLLVRESDGTVFVATTRVTDAW